MQIHKNENEIHEVSLFDRNCKLMGKARIWKEGDGYHWRHPYSRKEGIASSLEEAITAIENITIDLS